MYVILYIYPFLFRAPSSAFDRQNHLLLWRWSTMTQRSCWWTYFNLNVIVRLARSLRSHLKIQVFVAKLLICGSPNVPPHITHPSTVLSTPLPWWSNQNDGCQQSWHQSFLATKASSKESIKGGQHTAIQVQNLCGVSSVDQSGHSPISQVASGPPLSRACLACKASSVWDKGLAHSLDVPRSIYS